MRFREAGLSPYDIDVLTNHRPPRGTVSAGYIKQSLGHLQHCQEKVANHLMRQIRGPDRRPRHIWDIRNEAQR